MRPFLKIALLVALAAGLVFNAFPVGAAAKSGEAGLSGQLRQQKVPPLTDMGGKKVQTEYFSLTIPAGWSMPMPVKKNNLGMTALFGAVKSNLAVTVNVLKSPMSAKDIATQTLANMRKGGLKTGPLRTKGGLCYAEISGKVTGVAWFGSNNKGLASAVVILGSNDSQANELLKALKPSEKGLFPTAVK